MHSPLSFLLVFFTFFDAVLFPLEHTHWSLSLLVE